MRLVLLLDDYRIADISLLMLLTQGQGHGFRKLYDVYVKVLREVFVSCLWINVILGILVLCDTTIDSIINVGHLDLYFMVQ